MTSNPRNLPVFQDYHPHDSTTIRMGKSRPLSAIAMDGCIVRNADSYDSASGQVVPISMLGHSMNAVSIAKGASVTYNFTTSQDVNAVIRTALIPTQPNDKGDLRYSVSIDGAAPVTYSLKEPYRSERWKQNVLRGQTIRQTETALAAGSHTITITALDKHIILDQWMLDPKKDRKFYMFPVSFSK